MHSELLLLKHKNPNKSQQAPPGWFSQVNWFFPALLAWKHLPAVRKAPPSKTTTQLLSFQIDDLGQVTYVSTALVLGPVISHRGKHTSQALQAGKRDHNLSVHENDGGNQRLPCLPACSMPRGSVLWKEPLQAGMAAESLRKPNLNHFSPETNAQIWKRSCFTKISGEPSPQLTPLHQLLQPTACASEGCNPISSSAAFPFQIASLPLDYKASFPFLTPAVTRGIITSKINFAGQPTGLKRKPTFRGMKGLAELPGGDRIQCLVRSADPLHKWVSLLQGPFSAALCKQLKPASLLTRSLWQQGK